MANVIDNLLNQRIAVNPDTGALITEQDASPAGSTAVTIANGADVAQGAVADAAWSGTGNGTLIAILKALWGKLNAALSVSPTAYPAGATPVTGASGNVANGSAVATLTSASGKTAYITGFEVTGGGATLGLVVTVTVVGTITGTLSYTYAAAAGVLLANAPLVVEFPVAIPASGQNVNIVVTCPALGAGATNNTVVAHGYIV